MFRPSRFCLAPLLLAGSTAVPCIAGASGISPRPAPNADAAQPATPPVYPLEVELVASVNVAKLRVGDHILAKATRSRSYGACTVVPGSVLEGEVMSLDQRSHTSRFSDLALLFRLPCEVAPELTWIALLAPDTSGVRGLRDEGNPVSMQAIRSNTFGESGGVGRAGNTVNDHVDMSGRQSANLPAFLDPAPDRRIPRPTVVLTGQVWQLPELSLHVGAGPQHSTVVSSKGHDLRIPAGSVLVLTPPRPAGSDQASAGSARSISAPASTAVATTAPEEQLRCELPACSVVAATATTESVSPQRSISLGALGYRPLRSAEMQELEYGAALAFLDPDHLLFAFNPHLLVPRSPRDRPENHPHMLRGVVFDVLPTLPGQTPTAREGRVLEPEHTWRVEDSGQYLWPLPAGGILIHSGRQLLRLDGADLHQTASVALPGALAWLRLSPDGHHVLLGIIEELHTPSIHNALLEAGTRGPEEQVALLLLDDSLHELPPPAGNPHQSTLALAPMLSNDGTIRLLHAGEDRWHLRETRWDGQNSHIMATIRSSCMPSLASAVAGDLLISTCDHRRGERLYRVLRPNGTLAVRSVLDARAVGVLCPSSAESRFLLAIPQLHEDYLPGTVFHGSDLAGEFLRVHDARSGRVVFTTQLQQPSPTRQPAALSPDGSRLAVLNGDHILIYGLPPRPPIAVNEATRQAGSSPPSDQPSLHQ